MKYSADEQYTAILSDLERDIIHADDQALHGPFYAELNITADTLRAYADKCRADLARMTDDTNDASCKVHAFIAGR